VKRYEEEEKRKRDRAERERKKIQETLEQQMVKIKKDPKMAEPEFLINKQLLESIVNKSPSQLKKPF